MSVVLTLYLLLLFFFSGTDILAGDPLGRLDVSAEVRNRTKSLISSHFFIGILYFLELRYSSSKFPNKLYIMLVVFFFFVCFPNFLILILRSNNLRAHQYAYHMLIS